MLFSTVGEVKRVCVLPVREGRYSSLALVCVIISLLTFYTL